MAVLSGELSENLVSSHELTDDEYYRLLTSRRRRVLLYVLADQSDSLSVREVAKQVAKAESDDGTPASKETVDEVRIDLHHVHLPMLSDHGVVDYDWTTQRVEP